LEVFKEKTAVKISVFFGGKKAQSGNADALRNHADLSAALTKLELVPGNASLWQFSAHLVN